MNLLASWRRQGYDRTLLALVAVIVYLFPVYWMVATSIKSPPAIFASPPQVIPEHPTLSAYREAIFDNSAVIRAMRNSAIIAVGTTILTLILAAPAAYALARIRPRGSGLFTLLLLIGQLLPGIVVAGPLFVLFSRIDLINSFPALIIADGTVTLPFAVIVLRPFFLSIPRELESAAMVDGSTRFGAFFRIVLPLIRPGLITVAALSFLIAWGEFIFALSLNLNDNIAPVTVAMNKFVGQYGTEWDKMMAVATTVAIPIVAIFIALQRFIVGGLTTGATKE
ncbi:MAG: multiple sugar transport system permease protein [Thermomicrobiales bacterium]|jgi:multiple sugar transport system permease protein|nr:multiple sugar transport system permease protein [Thermomicrobiales bacterium]